MTDTHETSARPPRLAERLLAARHRGPHGEALLGDLLEEFHEARVPRLGAAAARRWFWRETLAALVTAPARDAAPRRAPPTGDPAVLAFLADLRHGARLLARAPAFTALCVLTFALGIGATTAISSVVGPVLLRPLPYPSPERIVTVEERGAEGRPSGVGFATYADLARDARSLRYAAAVGDWQPTLTDGGAGGAEPERVAGERVSWAYFRVLGVRPALGRDFLAEEDMPGKPRVVILSDGLWRRRFGGDPSVVGRAISIDGAPLVVAGVMPASFEHVRNPDVQLWRVLGYGAEVPYACRTCRHLSMVARLKPGVDVRAAAAELDALSAALVRAYPHDYAAVGTLVTPLQARVTAAYRPMLLALLGAASLVLLIAAANVASLQLARAIRREGEFAVRAALGAARGRLTRQLVAEGVLLAALGAAVGVLAAWVTLPALRAALPDRLPRLAAVRLDWGALAVAAGATLLLAVAAGLAPARAGGRAALHDALRRAGRLVGGGRRLARSGLVVAEVALAITLLVGAGLLSRTLLSLTAVDPGFDATHLLTMNVQATGPAYAEDADVYANHDRVLDAVRAVPGVVGAALASQLPLGGNIDRYGVRAQDRSLANPELAPYGDRYVVSPEFMRVMGIRLLRGRALTAADARDSAAKVVVVSQALARAIWGDADPVGRRVRMGGPNAPWRTVVGVAGNVRHRSLDADETQQIYIPERQWLSADNLASLVVRTSGDPAAVAAAVRRAVRAVDPAQPVTALATMDQLIAVTTAERRLARLLFGAFAGVALVLAAAGIYGVLASGVAERTREIGVRGALGAAPRDIARLVARQAVRLGGAGLVLGLAGAVALGRLLRGLLFGVGPADPLTLAGVAALLAAVAAVACVAPALRAARVDPAATLRAD